MSMPRWYRSAPEEQLGLSVHGPVILARSPGVVAALQSVVAYPHTLLLPVVVRASGSNAEVASRTSFGWDPQGAPPAQDEHAEMTIGLRVVVGVDDATGVAGSSRWGGSAGDDVFDYRGDHWVGQLPTDGRLTITVSWPEIGLAEATTELTLDSLDRLDERIVMIDPH